MNPTHYESISVTWANIKVRPPVFEKIIKNTTHRGLRSTCLFFVEYWKTFGEYKYYLKKSTKTQRKSNRKTSYFSAVSFNKLKNHFLLFFEFYLYLHWLIYCTKHNFCFFPRDKIGRTSHFVSQNQQIINANLLITILNFLRHQILNYCIPRKTTLIIGT